MVTYKQNIQLYTQRCIHYAHNDILLFNDLQTQSNVLHSSHRLILVYTPIGCNLKYFILNSDPFRHSYLDILKTAEIHLKANQSVDLRI